MLRTASCPAILAGLIAVRSTRAQHLEPKDLAHLGRARIGQNGASDIDGWDGTITAIPLLDTQRSRFVFVDIDLGIRNILLVQEPLGYTAVASPRRGIDCHCDGHAVSFSLSVIAQRARSLIKLT